MSEIFSFVFQLTAHVLGNKAEMDITQLVEQNPTLMRVGLFFEFNDARSRVATQLQKNIDRSKLDIVLSCSLSLKQWCKKALNCWGPLHFTLARPRLNIANDLCIDPRIFVLVCLSVYICRQSWT